MKPFAIADDVPDWMRYRDVNRAKKQPSVTNSPSKSGPLGVGDAIFGLDEIRPSHGIVAISHSKLLGLFSQPL